MAVLQNIKRYPKLSSGVCELFLRLGSVFQFGVSDQLASMWRAVLELGLPPWSVVGTYTCIVILSGLPWKRTEIILSFLRLRPSTAFQTFVDHHGYSIFSEEFLPRVVDIMVIWVKLTHSVYFSLLIPRISMFILAISCLTTSNLPWYMDLTFQVPM